VASITCRLPRPALHGRCPGPLIEKPGGERTWQRCRITTDRSPNAAWSLTTCVWSDGPPAPPGGLARPPRTARVGGTVRFVDFDTTLVMPLVKLGTLRLIRDVNPLIEVEGLTYIVLAQQITAVLTTELRDRVAHAPDIEDKVVKAIDRMLTNS
jgi:hypothetical protein